MKLFNRYAVVLALVMGLAAMSGRVSAQDKMDPEHLSDTVEVGYGTMSREDITSAAVSVKSEDFTAGNIQDASDMIRGKVAGLIITRSSGDPNASSEIRLRGIASINGDLAPLILVDGLPGDMNTVAPENIADISVLKDASAAAIYGSRAANGVILITTKSGRRDSGMSVNYSGYVAASSFARKADFMTAEDVRAGLAGLKDMGYETDWLGEISRPGFTHNNYLSLSGGTKSTTYAASVSYRDEQGVIKSTGNNQLKMTFNLSQYLFNDILKLNLNVVKGIHNDSQADPEFAYRQALIRNPTAPVYIEDTSGKQVYHEEFGRFQYYNPVSILDEQTGDLQGEWTNLSGSITVEPIKGWKTNLMMATHRANSMVQNYYSSLYYSNRIQWAGTGDPSGHNGSASKSQTNSIRNYIELTSRYDNIWGAHSLSALAGYSYNSNMFQGFSGWNSDFPTEAFLYNSLGSGSNYILDSDGRLVRLLAGASSYRYDDKLYGFFGRVSYGYDDRYNVVVSFRREHDTDFGVNYKWGNFPSASASWNIHNEEFMAETGKWLSNLKLRAGWGMTGIIPDTSSAKTPNPDLHWETSNEINIGVDMGLFADRLSFSLDLYDKTTSGIVYAYAAHVGNNLYSSVLANAGVMNNKGIELYVNAVPVRTKDFKWVSTLAVSHNSNKLVSLSNDLYVTPDYRNTGTLADPVNVSASRVEVGKAVGGFWGLKSVGGVSENGKWIVEIPRDVTYPNGSLMYEAGQWVEYALELNDDRYRQYLGTCVPQVNLSWGNTFSYKGFDLGIQLMSQLGFHILNTQRMLYQNNSIAYNRLRSAADALPVYDLETKQATGETKTLSSAQSQAYVSEFLERGDYVKLDNVTLGYTFDTRNNRHVKAARIYLSGDNLAVLTGYSGLDPEIAAGNPFWGAGIDDRDKYPTIRSIIFGVNLTF